MLADGQSLDPAGLDPLGLGHEQPEADRVVERVADELAAVKTTAQPGGVVEGIHRIGGRDDHRVRAVAPELEGGVAHQGDVLHEHLGAVGGDVLVQPGGIDHHIRAGRVLVPTGLHLDVQRRHGLAEVHGMVLDDVLAHVDQHHLIGQPRSGDVKRGRHSDPTRGTNDSDLHSLTPHQLVYREHM